MALNYGLVVTRSTASIGGLTMAEAHDAFLRLGGFPGDAMVPKAQTIHPQQCMIITDAPGKPKGPVQVTCPSCGGQRIQDTKGCEHCGAPAPKPREVPAPPPPPSGRQILQESLERRRREGLLYRLGRALMAPTVSGGPR